MMQIQATVAIRARNKIGESPVWDSQRQRLLWVDQATGDIHEARSSGANGWRETRQWNLGRPIAAVVPRKGAGLVVAADNEISLFDEATGAMTSFVRFDIDTRFERINEVKCDAAGRLWAATIATDFVSPRAALYRIDPDRTVTAVLRDVQVGNGFAWSADGRSFYFADSMTQSVDEFDFEPNSGTITNRRIVVKLERCAPDGLTVDDEGCLWVAAAGAGEVRRYARSGELLARVGITTPGVTSCTFGGEDWSELIITSLGITMPDVVCRLGVPREMLENNHPESGALFVCRPGPSGVPATPFAD